MVHMYKTFSVIWKQNSDFQDY